MRRKEVDNRPAPKPRKLARLWQAYLIWDELVEMRKRHELRLTSIEAGKSNLDANIEMLFMAGMNLDEVINRYKRTMVAVGSEVGPVWNWLTGIRGLGEGGLAAQLLAQIDDIGKFATVSKLWRFAGHGRAEYWINGNGAIQAPVSGSIPIAAGKPVKPNITGRVCETFNSQERSCLFVPEPKPEWTRATLNDVKLSGFVAPYNARLKSLVFLVVDQFIKQQTPNYVDLYYAEKERQRQLHPEPAKTPGSAWPKDYTDSHVHRIAMRKTGKIFLQHLWLTWRTSENLPVSEPYVQAILNHTHIFTPTFEVAN